MSMSVSVDPQQMVNMRAELYATMVDRADLYRNTSTQGAGGGFEDSFAAVVGATGIHCRVAPSPRLPKEVGVQDTEVAEGVWLIALPVVTGPNDPTIFTAKDRFLVTIQDTGIQMMFEVLFPTPSRTNELARRGQLRLVM